jgi:phospholipase/carboxylesterase
VAPRRQMALAGVVGYSGALVDAANFAAAAKSRPPALLVHGTDDPIVPFERMAEAAAALDAAGIAVETLACPGLPHSIDEAGLQAGAEFLAQRLGSVLAA